MNNLSNKISYLNREDASVLLQLSVLSTAQIVVLVMKSTCTGSRGLFPRPLIEDAIVNLKVNQKLKVKLLENSLEINGML